MYLYQPGDRFGLAQMVKDFYTWRREAFIPFLFYTIKRIAAR
jgi:hypothetical protein